MAKRIPVVAIVGKPNVGKSTIFNRVVKQRISIVEDTPGVTRDRIYSKAEWLTRDFRLIDTGGIEIENTPFQTQIKAQAQIAMEEADVIVFVVSAKDGLCRDDEFVAKQLYKWEKPIIVAVNKVDSHDKVKETEQFWTLGLGTPHAMSAEHGIGVGDVLDEVVKNLPKFEDNKDDNSVQYAIIGRPNVGKSSLTNAILGEERVIVSDIEGTTRDAIDTMYKRNSKEYTVVDTAGLRKKGKIWENIEKYSVLRALSAMDRADICLVVIDAEKGIIEQDMHIAGYAHDAGKGIVVVVNKWDTVTKDETSQIRYTKNLRAYFKFLDYAPVVYVSAKDNWRIHSLLEAVDLVDEAMKKHVSTSVLNDVINDAIMMNEPPMHNGDRLKIFYASQVAVGPPTFILFVDDPAHMHFSYQRYLENKLREAFGFEGTPIKLISRKRK